MHSIFAFFLACGLRSAIHDVIYVLDCMYMFACARRATTQMQRAGALAFALATLVTTTLIDMTSYNVRKSGPLL